MTRFGGLTFCVSCGLIGCAAEPSDSESEQAALRGPAASITISAQPDGSCELACFDVQSSKDVGFIAVDAAGCSESPVELSLYAVGESKMTPVRVTPTPHGNGKSCPDIPPAALKLDGLSGRHLVVCAAGAQSAEIFVKSGKTCVSQAFEIDAPEQCQADTPDWVRDMGELSISARTDVAADRFGNVLYAGVGGVTKLDGAGDARWSFAHAERVASDADGNVIVAGTFSTPTDLGFGPMIPTESSADVFVAKLDRDGDPIWAKSFGTAATESALSVAADQSGRIAVAIAGLGTIVLSPDGEARWNKAFWGAVAFDPANNLAVTGSFATTIDVGSGVVESASGMDAFVVKLDPDGNHVWSHFLSDVVGGDQVGTSAAFDAEGNLLIVGEVTSSIRLFGTDYELPTSPESSNDAAYIAKLDPAGNPLWAELRLFTEDMLDVAADAAGNVYVTGGDVGNVPPFRYNFVEMRDPRGAVQWKLGSTTLDWPGLGFGHALALDACDNLFWSLWSASSPPSAPARSVLAKIDRASP